MKTQSTSLRVVSALTGAAILLFFPQASAATLYWDGTSSTVNGLSSSTTGTTWSTSAGNWDNGTAEVFWTTTNSAVFGGTASTVTIGTGGVSIGGGSQFMRFDITGYIIDAGSNGLNFGTSATDNITLFANHTGAAATTTLTNTVGGSGNVILSAQNGGVANANTFLFNGTSAGGWSGTTTVNAGVTLSVAASSQALLNTTGGITLNGGNILLTNTATGSENTIDRINDTAAISSYGSTSISIANTATASRAYTETIGAITHNNGQLSIGFTTNQNQSANTQTLNVGGLTVNGSTATVAVNSGGSGAGSIGANSNIRVAGIANSTTAGEIIGPWMTAGSILGAQSDWAVYTSDVVGGYRRIASAAIGATAQSTWSSTTGNYTAATTAPTASPVNVRLTGDRFVNTLRATFAETTNAGNWTFDLANDKVVFASHNLSDGDVVQFRSAPTGLTDNRPYYVINAAAGEFKLSLTPGGAAVDLTNAAAGFMSTGLNLNGNTLGTNGFIVGTTGSASIGGGSASTLTLAAATSGNLYLHGASNIWIDPSIKDNGAGILTLVKSGTNTVTLSGDNTYTGGTVINAGSLTFFTTAAAQSGSSRNITFGGSGTLTTPDTSSFGTLTVDQGAVATLSGNNITFATTTGSGTVNTGSAQSKTLNLGDASTFTGNIALGYAFNNVSVGTSSITFTKLNDAVGSSIQIFRNQGGTDGGQVGQIALTGDVAPLTFNNRQIQFLPRTGSNQDLTDHVLYNNNATAANKWVINTSLLNLLDRNSTSFTLGGTNAGDNAFNGTIGDSTKVAGVSLIVQKTGTGKWILGGANTFTGGLVINQGTLSVATLNEANTAGALGMNNTLQLGGTAIRVKGSNIGSISGGGNNSGTLEYTGGAVTSSRSFYIGDSTAANTGGGTIANNGTGAITFSAAAFNPTQTGITGTRTLTLGGINTDNNEVQGIIRDNVATTGKVSFAKSGNGTWILSGANAMTGTNNISGGGTLILDYTSQNNTKLATGNLTVDGGRVVFRGGSAAEASAATTTTISGTTPSGTFFIREGGSGSTATINLGAITVTGTSSVMSFTDDLMATSTRANVNGILGAWFTVGDSWAANNGSNVITKYTGATAFASATGASEDINFELQGTGSISALTKTNTLRIVSTANNQSLDLAGNTLQVSNLTGTNAAAGSSGGILYTGGVNGDTYTITGTSSARLTPENGNGQALLINVYSGTLNLNVRLSNSGSTLNKTGDGTLVIQNNNTTSFTAAVRAYQGVLRLENAGATGSTAGGIFVQNGAALELSNNVAVGAEALTINGTGILNGGALRSISTNTTSTGYAGAVTIGAGGARINTDGTAPLTLSGGITTAVNSNVTFGGAGNTTVDTVAISGAGGLIKDGAGTTTLTATNTYTGATTVSDGTLLVNGSGSIASSSLTTVASTATIGGSGTVGALTVSSGGFISGGDSAGDNTSIFNINGAYSQAGLYTSHIAGTGAGNFDQLNVTGAVNITGGSLTAMFTSGSYTNGDLIFILTNDLSDAIIGTYGVAQGATVVSYGGFDWSISYTADFDGTSFTGGNDIALMAIPEPKAALLGCLGVLLLLRRRR